MKRKLALLLALVLSLSLMTACGSSKSNTSSESASTQEPSQEPASESGESTALPDYPKKTVEVIVPYAAGGGTDVMCRAVLAELDFTTMVTNIEGASSSIGTMEALHRNGDGYTILCHLPESMSCYAMTGTFSEPADELMIPICTPVVDPMCMVISANNGKFTNLDELKEYAVAHPGEVKWCATGTKSQNHMISALHWTAMELDVTYVPYDSGAKSRAALLGGNADIFVTQISEVASYVSSGDMIPLCVYDTSRSSILPDVPTAEELGYEGLISVSHRGFLAPPNTPQEIIDFWATSIKEVCENEEFQEKMRELGYDPVYTTAETLREYQANIKASFTKAMDLLG